MYGPPAETESARRDHREKVEGLIRDLSEFRLSDGTVFHMRPTFRDTRGAITFDSDETFPHETSDQRLHFIESEIYNYGKKCQPGTYRTFLILRGTRAIEWD